ncbi:MAG TPA: HAD family hydrolase [Anaerolineales bacterium]|jgi:HAD superfamily hydrolase (TIGR01549 family)|nr:HAD family hydrolase [Anaerolineales bacterium]HQX15618.1 HAD family hydrolase [Anaerolineales bacterium]
MPSNGIKAIFFDFDGTLRHNIPGGGKIFSQHVRSLGVEFNDEDFHRAMRWEFAYWANSADLLDDFKKHEGENEKFWVNYSVRRLVALGIPPRKSKSLAPKVSAYMQEFYTPESIVPDDVKKTLGKLKKQGYILAVISNRSESFAEELESHGIGGFFHFSLAGGEVNSFKPEPEIFQHALQRVAGLVARETIYVGDNYYADIVGSRRAGLRPVLFDPSGFFPEADCAVIKSFDELIPAIKNL